MSYSQGSSKSSKAHCNDGRSQTLRKQISAAESQEIYNQSIVQRNQIHQSLVNERQKHQNRSLTRRSKRTYKSQAKMHNSPFLVDLVAEHERIEEENKVLLRTQVQHQKYIQKAQEKAKNDLILRALQEDNELEQLRREKRQILREEKRLKALLEIEKVNSHLKQDRLAAERAEKQRKATKVEYRRLQNKELLDDAYLMKCEMLRIKHDVQPPPDNTFSTYQGS